MNSIKTLILLTALIALSGCAAYSMGRAKRELSEAPKLCANRQWPDLSSYIACRNSVETSIIQKRIPVVLPAFYTFTSKRYDLAQQTDIMNSKAVKAVKKYHEGLNEAMTILSSQEPKFSDTNSTLHKEWVGAKTASVCSKQETAVERGECMRDILRPIWERNAPDTIDSFDEAMEKNIELSRKLDANTSPESLHRALGYFTQGTKQALAELKENAKRDIEAANQQDAVARARALRAFGDFMVDVAKVSVAVAQAYADAKTHQHNYSYDSGSDDVVSPGVSNFGGGASSVNFQSGFQNAPRPLTIGERLNAPGNGPDSGKTIGERLNGPQLGSGD